MEEKSTRELIRIIRNSQTKLSLGSISMSNKEIDELYDLMFEAEKIILSRVKK